MFEHQGPPLLLTGLARDCSTRVSVARSRQTVLVAAYGCDTPAKIAKNKTRRLIRNSSAMSGKVALYAGAFDERIALTVAKESGGGGAASWRVSESLVDGQTLDKTNKSWFAEGLFEFSNSVERLPYDHHELMAMIAPRALLVLGDGEKDAGERSRYVACRAAHEVWKAFGLAERFGFSFVGERPDRHTEVEGFVDKFLMGRKEANTEVIEHPFEDLNYAVWFEGWSSGATRRK